MVVDPVFGPIVTAGLGGIHPEIFKDVASATAPLSEADALDLIKSLKAWSLFAGARGAQPADTAALAKVIAGLSRFAYDNSARIAEIDLNPIFVHGQGQGVSVADALIVTTGAPSAAKTSH